MGEKLTAAEFAQHWHVFSQCDAVPVEDFDDRAEAAGFIFLRSVTPADLERSFASELGIEPGGRVWDLTPAGLTALQSEPGRHE